MRLVIERPTLTDDLDFADLDQALVANIKRLRETQFSQLEFGPRKIAREVYADCLELLRIKLSEDPTGITFKKMLAEDFESYEVFGLQDWGQVFITSYFEPVIPGALEKKGAFTRPLYGVPSDLVMVDLKTFAGRDGILRGRILAGEDAKSLPTVVAYPQRSAIEVESLFGQSEVLAWTDPIDAFFLEVQGSGIVKLEDGSEVRVGYAAQNGHPYFAIGKHLSGVIPREKITLHSIEAHLRSLPPEEAQSIMNLNPSYVFFRRLDSAGITHFGTEVVSGRTIATDSNFYPKGALAFLEFEKPSFESASDTEPKKWEPTSRFVFDHDVGGAIRGPHRVDLFWGRGPAAKQAAGVIKGYGRLTYLVPRPSLVSRMSATASKDNLLAPEKR